MGLPLQSPNSATTNTTTTPTASSQPTSTTAPTPTMPTKASDLPPAAIELATKLFDYARAGSTNELLQYVAAGIPPNLTNGKGDTLLMLAAYHGHADTVRMLLHRGADPNVCNDRGQSPIAGAIFKGSDEVVRVLFEGVKPSGGNEEVSAERRADIWVGQPNAVDSARMFKKEAYLEMFGVAE